MAGRAAEVFESTGGHAAFVLETLRLLGDPGSDLEAAVPASLQAAVQTRIRQVGPEVE